MIHFGVKSRSELSKYPIREPGSGSLATQPLHHVIGPMRRTDVTYIRTATSSGAAPSGQCFQCCEATSSVYKNRVAASTLGGGVGSGGGVNFKFTSE